MYSALDVAKYIIDYEASQGRTVSNLRLQKLLYFVQIAFLATKDSQCFNDDLEAWDYGPVVPEVYRKYKIFGSTMIPTAVSNRDQINTVIGNNDQQIINSMLDLLQKCTTRELVEISHAQDPWKNIYVPGANNVITKEAMREYVRRNL